MTIRVLVLTGIMLAATPAAAQWQPLDGNGGFGGTPSASPTAPAPNTMPSAPGGSGYSGGIQGWTSGPITGSPTTQPPASGGNGCGSGGCGGGTPAATPAPAPAAGPTIEITYQGQAAADPRTATMRLRISGNQATAHVTMQSICQQNVRVGGADIDLTGALNGPWESEKSSIDGSWTGVDHHCGTDDPNQGQFSFFLKDIGMGKKVLHLRITGKNGRYGWNFTPKNKVYTASGGGAPAFIGAGGGFDSPLGPPRQGFTTGVQPPSFAAASYGDRLRQLFTKGTIALQIGESAMRTLPSADNLGAGYDANFNRMSDRPNCVTTQNANFILTPAGLADTVRVGSAVRITARSAGKGELWMQTIVRCRDASGATSEAKVLAIYIVLVGDQAAQDYRDPRPGTGTPPTVPPGDIDQAVVSGYVRMADNGEPVAGATVTLVTPQGGAIQDSSWKTGADGRFRIVAGADKNLRSGRYEVMVQKLRMPAMPPRCTMRDGTPAGIGIDCDLWPVTDHFVTLSRDAPNADAGMIDLDFLRYIPSRGGSPRGSDKGTFTNIVPYPRAEPDQNQGSQTTSPAPRFNRFR